MSNEYINKDAYHTSSEPWLEDLDCDLDVRFTELFGLMYPNVEAHLTHDRPFGPEARKAIETLVAGFIADTVPEAWLACPYTCQSVTEVTSEGYTHGVWALERFGVDPRPLLSMLDMIHDRDI